MVRRRTSFIQTLCVAILLSAGMVAADEDCGEKGSRSPGSGGHGGGYQSSGSSRQDPVSVIPEGSGQVVVIEEAPIRSSPYQQQPPKPAYQPSPPAPAVQPAPVVVQQAPQVQPAVYQPSKPVYQPAPAPAVAPAPYQSQPVAQPASKPVSQPAPSSGGYQSSPPPPATYGSGQQSSPSSLTNGTASGPGGLYPTAPIQCRMRIANSTSPASLQSSSSSVTITTTLKSSSTSASPASTSSAAASSTKSSAAAASPTAAAASNPNTAPAASTSALKAADIASHNSATDCYVVYQSNVYDITSWMKPGAHPGGKAPILKFCGGNKFEAAYTAQHAGKDFNSCNPVKKGAFSG